MIAGIAAIAAFLAALVMLILSLLGLVHARRTSPATEILSGVSARPEHPGPVTEPVVYPADNGLAAAVPGGSDSHSA